MTPPAAAAAPRTRTRRTTAPPRRMSGPARGRAGAATAAPPLALRLGGAVHGLAEHHLLERIIRGRTWIAILGIGLMGIVFMQVSMLRLNAGIGQSVERAATLERENSAMRAAISELSSSDRIAAEALELGLVLPPGTPRFLDARGADARKALASMTRPGEGIVTMTETAPVTTTAIAPTLADTSVAPTPETTLSSDAAAPATPVDQNAVPEMTATTTAAPPAEQPAQTQTPVAPEQQQAAAPTSTPPPTSTGGVDASGQVG